MFGVKNDQVTPEKVKAALSTVMDPDLHVDIVSLNMISDIKVSDSKVSFTLTLTTPACPVKEKIEEQCREVVKALPGVSSVEMESTASVAGQKRLPGGKEPVSGVKHIIAITSGKGGVGKSSVAVNLAVALAQLGAKVGLLDADVTGPNVPIMMGVEDYQPTATKDQRILPAENFGVKIISMAFFVKRDDAIIWRGPMLDKAIRQFLRDVDWGQLDYLLVDMPPGTSDAQLSLVQATQLSGGIIVTTPQEVALLDGRKGLAMFQRMEVPVLGFIENMSYFQPPGSNERFEIFGHGGGKRLAEECAVPFLGEVPLNQVIREGSDSGKPITAMDINHPLSQIFVGIAKQVAAQVSIHALAPAS